MNLVTMRPPMQTAALQQQHDYIHHHHHHQQQQQHHSQQQSLIATPTPKEANQQKLKPNPNPKDILLETTSAPKAHLVPRRNTQVHHQKQPPQQQQQRTHHNQQEQHQQQVQEEKQLSHQTFHNDNFEDSIQLVDLSSSGGPLNTSSFHEFNLCQSAATKTRSNSVISTCPSYSRSSSSDDGSYIGGDKLYFAASTPIFDDPAEHFIINFPAADSPTHIRSNVDNDDIVINLPLSETEPLLTGIDERGTDLHQRTICLNKNSASLIFTRKELSQQQQQKPSLHLQQERNNSRFPPANSNNNFVKAHKRNSISNIGTAKKSTGNREEPRLHHQRELKQKHRQHEEEQSAPVPHHQQHRHSLQLNYNNNLISSVTDSGKSNNNFCWPSPLAPPIKSNFSRVGHSTTVASGKTAAATRKQHAYSWYAPVYSALEEELEQDSRDSSPVHNLANTKKLHSNHYHRRSVQNSNAADNETDFLLETRNQINIQAQLHLQSHSNSKGNGNSGGGTASLGKAVQPPKSLPLPHHLNNFPHPASEFANGSATAAATSGSSYDGGGEGPHAGSLGLAGGPLPRLKRWENFIKNFFVRPSNGSHGGEATFAAPSTGIDSPTILHLPASPEIRITRTPSDQNVVIMGDPSVRRTPQVESEKLASDLMRGSSSSLNVVHQKLWNIMRRDGSASSLYQEKSNSIVQYRGMRKCETVLALTRPTSSVCSPVLGVGPGIIGGAATPHMGSGIFSATGVEQIRPLNRLRNSVASMNATCSRCSSLLSLAASGSRYSLNISANGAAGNFVNTMQGVTTRHQLQTPPVGRHQQKPHIQQQQQALQQQPLLSPQQPHIQQQQQALQQQPLLSPQQPHKIPSFVSSSNLSSRSRSDVTDSKGPSVSGQCSRKSSAAANSSTSPPSNVTPATCAPSTSTPNTPTKISNAGIGTSSSSIRIETVQKQPITVTSLLAMSPRGIGNSSSSSSSLSEQGGLEVVASYPTLSESPSASSESNRNQQHQLTKDQHSQSSQQPPLLTPPHASATSSLLERSFEMFTCKLCLIDVEAAEEATTLTECGCQFCTECMKAYIEFEISEGAYEISCPDAQCPSQGIITLPEIANLTTPNLMKKHHRYRLNREIELDKSRTWCPRAGCETVCLVGAGSQNDAAPSTSTSHSAALASLSTSPASTGRNGTTEVNATILLCAVQCPSCKDEFCSACKKAWHPNISCEENSRRLVADGQDDIGIPFDSDLIKCCPMCAVPIEKDEGCAQMMCKRCKHVFCWYCLASLDDDFLLRHYDKGPCKNKLGHSRASVVWHRAQVIGIFAGFGILLLVASPLLLLAAPCIICCKCRICSGSKVDEVDGELDEATALQS